MNKYKGNKNFFRTVIILLIIIAIFSTFFIIRYFYDLYISKSQSNLLNEINITENNNLVINIKEEEDTKNLKTERMLKLEELKKENEDIVGWVEIENTDINYPVLQADDNDFYMNHNYKKEKSQRT